MPGSVESSGSEAFSVRRPAKLGGSFLPDGRVSASSGWPDGVGDGDLDGELKGEQKKTYTFLKWLLRSQFVEYRYVTPTIRTEIL